MKPRFAVGTKYKTRARNFHICTVVDIHTTYNLAGAVVGIGYVAEHEFCGQVVTERNIPDATIAIGVNLIDRETTPGK